MDRYNLPHATRAGILIGLAVLAFAVTLFLPPIPQPGDYHQFADQRRWLGVPHAGDVFTNAGFLVVGIIGLASLWRRGRAGFRNRGAIGAFATMSIGLMLVAAGSAYYHAGPSNGTLLWDRLPMTTVFLALLAGMVADRIDGRIGLYLLPILVMLGAGGAFYWHASEVLGRGDLRFYFLAQAIPALLIPTIHLLYRAPSGSGRRLVLVCGWYGLAVIFEQFDHEAFALFGGAASGHNLKHLAAAIAAFHALALIQIRVSRGRTAG